MAGNSQPLVSVLVPCYNVERYVTRCLDSLAAQTLESMEFICINDGSTDATTDIIREFAERDSRFRVIEKPNSGYGASMNRGLDAAQGRYVGILESDDFCESDTFEKLADAISRTGAQVAKANFFFYWSTPEEKNEKFEFIKQSTPDTVVPAEYPQLFWYMPSIWSALYDREYLTGKQIRFLETPGASFQDTSFTFKVWACADKVALLDDAYVHYRQDNEASSINSPGKTFCVCDEFEEIERFLGKHPEMDALWPVETRLKFDSYIWNYWRLNPDLRTQFISRFYDEFKQAERDGLIDYQLYLPWAEADLRHLLKDPTGFHRWARITNGKNGHFGALVRYFKVGGLPLVGKRLAYKEQ